MTELSAKTPAARLRVLSDQTPQGDRSFVLYWMTTARRAMWNFALQRAVAWAVELKRPLVIVEALATGGRWDTERNAAFALQGMADNQKALADRPVLYYPFVERKAGACRGLADALARLACVVVSDRDPIPAPHGWPDAELPVRIEQVDSLGLLPIAATDRAYPTAFAFRRMLQRFLPDHLTEFPAADPMARVRLPRLAGMPAKIARIWPAASASLLACNGSVLARLPLDHAVKPAALRGGATAAGRRWRDFLRQKLARYGQDRGDEDSGSGLSPYLRFGHISVHQLFHDLAKQEAWSPDRLGGKITGRREGWWGMSNAAEVFLDELITWRELGYAACAHDPQYDRYAGLPDWSQATLKKHARDRRDPAYSLAQLAASETYDPLWNEAQRRLVEQGRLQNYVRMLWGKKVLQWTRSPQEALDVLIELNNRYALDGQDPNSYSGIMWVLGRYDRPWGPERPIFGTVRYMSSECTARKIGFHAR